MRQETVEPAPPVDSPAASGYVYEVSENIGRVPIIGLDSGAIPGTVPGRNLHGCCGPGRSRLDACRGAGVPFMRGRPRCLRKYCGRVFGLAYSDEHRPRPLRSESSLAQYETTKIARPRDGSARRMAYAARLWLVDAALFRLDHYHWESRRRRLKKYDLRRRAKQSGSSRR